MTAPLTEAEILCEAAGHVAAVECSGCDALGALTWAVPRAGSRVAARAAGRLREPWLHGDAAVVHLLTLAMEAL